MESTKDIRKAAADTRVHAVIYFLPPTGKLKDLDIEALTKLSLIVNVIPVIAKSDTMTVDEIKMMKQMVHFFKTLNLKL
jgi:septin family protein